MPTLTSELKILITPELRAEIDAARTTKEGTVSLAEWVRGAIEGRLRDRERVREISETPLEDRPLRYRFIE